MSLTRCPHCRVVLTEDEQKAARCPACASELWEDVPAAALEPASGRAGRGGWTRALLLGGGSLAVLLLLGGLGWYGWTHGITNLWPAQQEARPDAPLTASATPEPAPGQAVAKVRPQLHWRSTAGQAGREQRARAEADQAEPPEAPMIEEAALRSTAVARLSSPMPSPIFFPRVPVGRVDMPQPPLGQPQRNDQRLQPVFAREDVRRVDRPNGEYRLDVVNREQKIKLVGRVKILKIGLVNERSLLDALQLEAKEIVFLDRIDGGSQVLLNAPGGKVRFKGRVDGRSRLEVRAPKGSVIFTEPTTPRNPGSKIDGGSHVSITAQTVTFRGALNGDGTVIDLVINAGGQVEFQEIDGHTSLQYRKANPREPAPVRVKWGIVRGAAKVQEVN